MAATFRARYDQPVTLAELSTLEPELLVNGELENGFLTPPSFHRKLIVEPWSRDQSVREQCQTPRTEQR